MVRNILYASRLLWLFAAFTVWHYLYSVGTIPFIVFGPVYLLMCVGSMYFGIYAYEWFSLWFMQYKAYEFTWNIKTGHVSYWMEGLPDGIRYKRSQRLLFCNAAVLCDKVRHPTLDVKTRILQLPIDASLYEYKGGVYK